MIEKPGRIMVETRPEESGMRPNAGLSALRRDLMLRVCEGDQKLLKELGPVLYHYHHFTRCDEILIWLIQHRITGVTFKRWFFEEQNGSFLGSGEWVLQRLEKRREKRHIRVAKDYRS